MNEKKILFESLAYLRRNTAVDINIMIPNIISNPGVAGVDSDEAVCEVVDGVACTSGIFGVRVGVDEFFVGSIRVM